MVQTLLMAGGQGGSSTMIMMVLIMVVFYFFMIYPQMKKNKEQKKFRENIAKGDRIITIGGVHGKIVETADTTFIIESEGTRLKIDRTAVSMEASKVLNAPKKEEKK